MNFDEEAFSEGKVFVENAANAYLITLKDAAKHIAERGMSGSKSKWFVYGALSKITEILREKEPDVISGDYYWIGDKADPKKCPLPMQAFVPDDGKVRFYYRDAYYTINDGIVVLDHIPWPDYATP